MLYLKNQDHDFSILNVSNQTIVADAIPPFTLVIRYESFTMTTRIIRSNKVLLDPGHDDPRLLGDSSSWETFELRAQILLYMLSS